MPPIREGESRPAASSSLRNSSTSFPSSATSCRPALKTAGPRGGAAMGSGFLISADGYAVTNNHVVQDADEVTVKIQGGAEFKAEVIGTDPKTDLALIKIKSDKPFQFVKFAETQPRVGDLVMAVGNPFGLGGSVTTGIVSARGRDIGSGPYDDFLQIDASINRGNSGGPAFNLEGEVVGVNTAIFSPSGGSVGIGFAIPAATTQDVIASLKDNGSVTRGWLGVQIQPVTDEIAESLGLARCQGRDCRRRDRGFARPCRWHQAGRHHPQGRWHGHFRCPRPGQESGPLRTRQVRQRGDRPRRQAHDGRRQDRHHAERREDGQPRTAAARTRPISPRSA